MLLNEAAYRFHAVGLGVAAERLGPAAQTSRVPVLPRLFGSEEELDVFPAGTARRTRRPAIHTRTRDGENEFSIAGGIAREHGLPARFVGCPRVGFRFGLTCGHQAFRCEYGIGGHRKKSLRRRLRAELSESCGQSEICTLKPIGTETVEAQTAPLRHAHWICA